MRAIQLFKTQTGVITIFIALLVPTVGSTSTDAAKDANALIVEKLFGGGGSNYCLSKKKEIESSYKEFREACSASGVPENACLDPGTLPKCVEMKEELDDFLSGGYDDDDTTNQADCDKLKDFIRAGCKGFLDDTEQARRVYSEYRRELKDLQKERDRAKKEADEKRKEMQDQLNKLDDDAFKEDKEWQETRRELNDEIQKEIAQAESEKTEAWARARQKLDEMEVAYMDLQKHIRRLQTSIGVMNAQWAIQCRLTADAEAKLAEKEFEARLAEERKIVKNYSFSTAARKLKNELKKKRRKITNRYNEVYARCIRGEIEPGANIRAKITEAEVQVANETIDANNRVQRLERLKKETAENLQSIITSLENQKAQRVASLQQAINELDRNHHVRSNQIALQKMQLTNELQIQKANADKEMGNIAEQIEDFRRERLRQSAIAKCNLPGKEEKDEARKAFHKIKGLFDLLKSACTDYVDSNCPNLPIPTKDSNFAGKLGPSAVCQEFLAAIERASKDRSRTGAPMTPAPKDSQQQSQEKGTQSPVVADPKDETTTTSDKTTQ